MTTLWSPWSSRVISGSAEDCLTCVLIADAMAGTNVMGFNSRSSHRTSAKVSGVIRASAMNIDSSDFRTTKYQFLQDSAR